MKKYIIVLLISLLFGFKANSKIIFESPKNERHTISDKMISRSVEFIKRNLQ